MKLLKKWMISRLVYTGSHMTETRTRTYAGKETRTGQCPGQDWVESLAVFMQG